jgi:hypothetical protein
LARMTNAHVSAPKLADMVRAHNFFKCNRRKPILQATVSDPVTDVVYKLDYQFESSIIIIWTETISLLRTLGPLEFPAVVSGLYPCPHNGHVHV